MEDSPTKWYYTLTSFTVITLIIVGLYFSFFFWHKNNTYCLINSKNDIGEYYIVEDFWFSDIPESRKTPRLFGLGATIYLEANEGIICDYGTERVLEKFEELT